MMLSTLYDDIDHIECFLWEVFLFVQVLIEKELIEMASFTVFSHLEAFRSNVWVS